MVERSSALGTMKGDSGGSGCCCLSIFLILGNCVIAIAGLALSAECIYFVTDQDHVRPLLVALGNTDLYAAAWIGIFTGFAFFLLAIFGIVGVIRCCRWMLMVYIILMLVVYCFEAASAITATTQRDYFTSNLFLQQMLSYYQNNTPGDTTQQEKVREVTETWNYVMLKRHCCGVNGPQDWQNYTSAFRAYNPDPTYPWPTQCCTTTDIAGTPVDIVGCRMGVPGYLNYQGCYDWIVGPLNRLAFAVAWFGFAILVLVSLEVPKCFQRRALHPRACVQYGAARLQMYSGTRALLKVSKES
ncbi:uroplakin-1b-like [Hyperolius riggenbachi]|uniref:uroplakin-1b-like n=1 Tax=Hyperolius riggenbachi TaxID=752182 RepID=UPI0035A3C90F